MEKCPARGKRITCVIDGDSFWLNGKKYRPIAYDTPEPRTGVCGEAFEKQLAAKATARFIHLLNSNDWEIIRTGRKDRNGRHLVHVRINGRDIGDILISEGLARRWPNGHEWWCD
ncbi:thermonuclease family protein [Cohaesibacter gelatinilyticus]|nr:thermonuclease family protein [Cohaesibacter gelatinilyticus]